MFYLIASDDPRGGGVCEYKNKNYGKVSAQKAKWENATNGYFDIVTDNQEDAEEYGIEYMDKKDIQ